MVPSFVAVNAGSGSGISHPGCIWGNEASSRLGFGIFTSFTCESDVQWRFLQHRECADGPAVPPGLCRTDSSKAVVLWQLMEKFFVFCSFFLLFFPPTPFPHINISLSFPNIFFFFSLRFCFRGDLCSGSPAWNVKVDDCTGGIQVSLQIPTTLEEIPDIISHPIPSPLPKTYQDFPSTGF